MKMFSKILKEQHFLTVSQSTVQWIKNRQKHNIGNKNILLQVHIKYYLHSKCLIIKQYYLIIIEFNSI